jgi:hypothetical protein
MSDIVPVTLIIALFCETALIAMLVWSIFAPDRRLWPPRHVSSFSQIMVWMPTISVCGSAIIVGLIQWNALGWALLHRSRSTRNAPYPRRNSGGAFKTWAAKADYPVENPNANPSFCFLIFEVARL